MTGLPFDPLTVVLKSALFEGKPAIHIAAEKGNIEAMVVLLGRGESIGLLSMDSHNVLHVAAMLGLDDVCTFVLKYAKAHSSSTHNQNYLCLSAAYDFDMFTPLSLAIKHGHLSTAEILLQYESRPVFIQNGKLVLDCYKTAVDYNQLLALEFLLRRKPPSSHHLNRLLRFAIDQKNIEMPVISTLLRSGADPNSQNCLQAAAEVGSVEIMRLLVRHGAKINFQQQTLHFACLSGNEAVVKYSLKLGASPTTKDENFHLAFEYTGTGLMAFAELGIAFPTLCMDHLLLWHDLEKKLQVWDELDLPINLSTERTMDFVDATLFGLNKKQNYFRTSNALSKLAFQGFMSYGADLDTLARTRDDFYQGWNKKAHLLLQCSLDPFSFDEETPKAILARFVESHVVENKLSKLVVKYIHPLNLQAMLSEAIGAFRQTSDENGSPNKDIRKTATALITFLIRHCGADATKGLMDCHFLYGWNADTIRLLATEFGADVNFIARNDTTRTRTPLLQAVCLDHNVGAVKAMLECGAKVNQKGSDGNNEVMKLMLGKDCPRCGDCKKNGLEIAEILLEAGSSMNMKNREGQTALSLSEEFDYGFYRKLFLRHKEKIEIEAAFETTK